MLEQAPQFSHSLLKEIIEPGDFVVDATMGNGNDSEFLAKLVGEEGHVLAFDVQALAVENTRTRLENKNLLHQSQLELMGHEEVGKFLNHDLKAAIFNLGYLPQSDKSIITRPNTTVTALEAMTTHLVSYGRIVLVVYYGHEGGLDERNAVLDYVKTIPQEYYHVLKYEFINQTHEPPFIICIEKRPPRKKRS
jgi:hypothetical protein